MQVRCYSSLQDYQIIYDKMRVFTLDRTSTTTDELWLLEHKPVYTQGQAGKAEHIFNPGNIPVVQSDRGGQVTYHGPGQLMAYILIDLKRRNMSVRDCVTLLETTVIELLNTYDIPSHARKDAPGIYLDKNGAKICSIGMRIRKGYTYHGLCLNVDGDLTPFLGINPCGFNNLTMTQISEHANNISLQKVTSDLKNILLAQLEQTAPIQQLEEATDE